MESLIGGRASPPVAIPGAESMFSRRCGGISGRMGIVTNGRGRRVSLPGVRGLPRVGEPARPGDAIPGAESTLSRVCGGIRGRIVTAGRGRRVPLHGARRSPRAVESARSAVEIPGAESMISEACSEIPGRVSAWPIGLQGFRRISNSRAGVRIFARPIRNIIGEISVFRKAFLAAVVSQFEIPVWAGSGRPERLRGSIAHNPPLPGNLRWRRGEPLASLFFELVFST